MFYSNSTFGTARALGGSTQVKGSLPMIRIDAGNDLCELLSCAEQLARRGRLDVAVPFFDVESGLWRRLVAAAESGSRVRLLTRPPSNELQASLFENLRELGVRLVQLPHVHAKSVLLTDRKGRHSTGWIGSSNFTKASESTAQELGVVFRGRGPVETRLIQQALIQMDAWEYRARADRKSA
jgi:phosphatidylserine/phosphatidylglycerophosphate/cardiolipin synthase-like enzyme